MAAPQINFPDRRQLSHAAVTAKGLSFIVDALQQRLQPCSIYSYVKSAYWGSCVDGSAYAAHDDRLLKWARKAMWMLRTLS
jgi:hypothetical protein